MNHHTLQEVLRQLRKNNRTMLFPLLREKQFQSVYIRPYNMQTGETEKLAASMQDQLSYVSLIHDICFVLEHEDIPRNKSLEIYIRNLHKIFSGYSSEGHYAGRYFLKVLSFLEGFLAFIRLSNQRDEELLHHLQALSTYKQGKGESLDFNSAHITFYINCKTRNARELHRYHDIFNDFLREESDKSQGLKVTTRTEQCLMTLTDTIRQSIDHSHAVMELLDEYNETALLAEMQGQYN